MTTHTYQRVKTSEYIMYCGTLRTNFSSVSVEQVDENTLPRESRKRPDPLDLTKRAKQYREVRTPRVASKISNQVSTCNGKPTTWPRQDWDYAMPPTLIPSVDEPDWALDLRNKIQEDKVSFAESIGEWKQAVKATESVWRILARAAKRVRQLWRVRKNRRAFRDLFRRIMERDPDSKVELYDFANVDMALKFGILPQVQLAYDSAEAVNRISKLWRRLQVTKYAQGVEEVPGDGGGYYRVTAKKSVRAIAYVRYDPENRDFTSGNLAEALWAGTRLSFIVDWAVNVGSYLSSFNAMKGVIGFKAVLCRRETRKGVDTRIPTGYTTCQKAGSMIYRSYERTVVQSLPWADHPPVPLFANSSIGKMVSAAEIFWSIRRRNLVQ